MRLLMSKTRQNVVAVIAIQSEGYVYMSAVVMLDRSHTAIAPRRSHRTLKAFSLVDHIVPDRVARSTIDDLENP